MRTSPGGGRGRATLLVSALGAGVLLSQAPAAARAQGSTPDEPLVTDRPTNSASPELVPAHALQLELGYVFTRLDTDSGRTDTRQLPDLLARFGISDRVEARLVATGWTFENSSTGRETGFMDIGLGVKIGLADERGRRPQMALLADVSLPVGAVGFTSDYVIPKVLFLAAHGLTDRLALTYNLGPSFVTTKDEGGTRTNVTLHYAVALSEALGGRVSLFGELYGALAFSTDIPDSHTFQAGATVLLTSTLQVDVRGGVGIVDSVPDWLFGAGLAVRVPH